MDKREDYPNTDADEPSDDKVDTILSFDVSAVDSRENNHLEEVDDEVNTSSMLNAQSIKSKIKIWMEGIPDKLLSSFFEDIMPDLVGWTTEGAIASTDCVPNVACPIRMEALNGIMEALKCGQNNMIGVLGETESEVIAFVLKKVSRRIKRDMLFDMVVMATVSHKPNNRKIQDEIAAQLGLEFDDDGNEKEDVAKRAKRLRERILMEQKILVILCDICQSLDLNKIGIPFGTDHTGCKLLLTSASEDVLANQMHVQKIFNLIFK